VGGGEERDGWLANYGELKEWFTQDGDPMHNQQRPKLFIFDEASSSAGGSGSDGHNTKKKMGPLAYKIRKYGGSLIVIGHDGKDVHPLIRELGTAIHKEGLKEATFYQDVRNRRGHRPIMSVTGIPETDWRYDDKGTHVVEFGPATTRRTSNTTTSSRTSRCGPSSTSASERTLLRTGNWRKDALGRLYVLSTVEAVQGGRQSTSMRCNEWRI